MSKRLRFLVTNDDGYFSDGINALFEELSGLGEAYMVAPDREQSASSHSLTLSHPLRINKIGRNRFVTDGTPTDCVMLGMHLIFRRSHPDFIISGINHGPNMGDDVTYSGTVAAAIEGAILRIPSIALSMANYEPGLNMVRAARFVTRLVRAFQGFELPASTFLNVNFPADNGRAYRRWQFTSQGRRQYKDVVIPRSTREAKITTGSGAALNGKNAKGATFRPSTRGWSPLPRCIWSSPTTPSWPT
jgi:5'-nucleotidase